MDNEPTPASPPSPSVPPPDLPKYVPPTPSIATAPVITPPNVPTAEEARRINLKVAKDPDAEANANGAIAQFNPRVVAAFIDLLLAFGLLLAAMFILPGFASKIGWLIGIGYLITRDSLPFLGGQSVGKKAMGLKALTLDDKPLIGNWEAGLFRNGVLIIPLFPLVEIFVLLTRDDKPERGRRLGDEWAKTKVVIHRPEPTESTPS
jgi:uncharacterized RDD family membrane protein YckC